VRYHTERSSRPGESRNENAHRQHKERATLSSTHASASAPDYAAASAKAAFAEGSVSVVETEARTKYEACCDVAYSVRLNALHKRFYGRVRKFISFLTLFSGSAAFAGALASNGFLVAAAGVFITSLTLLDQVCDFSSAASAFENQRKRYLALAARQDALSLEQIDQELHQIAADDPAELEALRVPAYNEMLRAKGHEDRLRPISRWSRFLSAIA
jgi:hypothetical protein